MSAPKGILKPSTPYVHAPPAKAGGSKLKHTLAVAQKSSKAKKARRDADGEEDDVDMNGSGGSADEDEDGSEGDDDDEEAGTDEEIERSKKGKAKATPSELKCLDSILQREAGYGCGDLASGTFATLQVDLGEDKAKLQNANARPQQMISVPPSSHSSQSPPDQQSLSL